MPGFEPARNDAIKGASKTAGAHFGIERELSGALEDAFLVFAVALDVQRRAVVRRRYNGQSVINSDGTNCGTKLSEKLTIVRKDCKQKVTCLL